METSVLQARDGIILGVAGDFGRQKVGPNLMTAQSMIITRSLDAVRGG